MTIADGVARTPSRGQKQRGGRVAAPASSQRIRSGLLHSAVLVPDLLADDQLWVAAVAMGRREIDFSLEVIPSFLGRIQVYRNSIYHRDIGTLNSWRLAQNEILQPQRISRQLIE